MPAHTALFLANLGLTLHTLYHFLYMPARIYVAAVTLQCQHWLATRYTRVKPTGSLGEPDSPIQLQ
jgi:hypothetical protein